MGEIETDLSDFTAPPNPYGAALTTLSMTTVGLIPGVGGAATTLAQGTLAPRQAERDAAFAMTVARRFQKLEDRPEPQDILDSDEFVAAWIKTERIAAETANEAKHERIARVLTHSGPWGRSTPKIAASFSTSRFGTKRSR